MRIIVTDKEEDTSNAARNAAKLLVNSVKIEGNFIFDKEVAINQLAPLLEKTTIKYFKDQIERIRNEEMLKNVFGGTDDIFESFKGR